MGVILIHFKKIIQSSYYEGDIELELNSHE